MIVSTNEKSVRITSAKRYKIFVSSDKVWAILSTGTLAGKQNDHLLHFAANLMGDFSLHLKLDHVIENMHILRLWSHSWATQVCDFLTP